MILLRVEPQFAAHRLGELAVTGADFEDGKTEAVQEVVGRCGPGHQPEVLEGEIPEQGVGGAVGLKKRQDELQGVTGLMFRAFDHIGQIIVITANLAEKPVAVGLDKLPAELEGMVIEGQRPFAGGI